MTDWDGPFAAAEEPDHDPDEDAIEDATHLLVRLSRSAASLPWFARLGEHPTAEDRQTARFYCELLGFPHAEIAIVAGWSEVESAAEITDWDSEAWTAGEQLRAALTGDACDRYGEDFVREGLEGVMAFVSDAVRAAASEAAGLWEVTDDALVNAAAGAALRAVHNAALVLLASTEDEHALGLEYRLFELGRWPVALTGRTLHLF